MGAAPTLPPCYLSKCDSCVNQLEFLNLDAIVVAQLSPIFKLTALSLESRSARPFTKNATQGERVWGHNACASVQVRLQYSGENGVPLFCKALQVLLELFQGVLVTR